ncbi:ExoD family exopolysaccharide synthesis protein [Anopheles sinensis]|uniref:ExoD family exopolysaccharide synthesis protein n=1 Tax=Anopheles sinensis TaxID=74873 RepID=A0A084VQ32_ANOSI|nr:ExoD family exopolysaccharide synthesis protein [Anopheles sinensis]
MAPKEPQHLESRILPVSNYHNLTGVKVHRVEKRTPPEHAERLRSPSTPTPRKN